MESQNEIITVKELATKFGLSLDELHEMSTNETPEYILTIDNGKVICLVSDGYKGLLVISDDHEDQCLMPIAYPIVIPSQMMAEIIKDIEDAKIHGLETVH